METFVAKEKKTYQTADSLPMLPLNVIVGALKYADKVESTDRMIPHENVMAEIYRRRGWQ